jgi:tetratricopeptide (TPR) repeat protein
LLLLYAREEFSANDEAERRELEVRLAEYYTSRAISVYTRPDWFEFERANLLAVARLEHDRGWWESLNQIRLGMKRHLGNPVHFAELELVFKYERSALRGLHLAEKEAGLIEEFAVLVAGSPDRAAEAASHWAEAEQLWKVIGNEAAAGRCAFQQSCFFARKSDWRKAIEDAERSRECFEAWSEYEACGVVVIDLLNFALMAADAAALDLNIRRGEQLLSRVGMQMKAQLLWTLGRAHRDLGRPTEAISYFERSAECNSSLEDSGNEALTYAAGAKLLDSIGSWHDAILWLRKSIAAWRRGGAMSQMADAWTMMGRCYALVGEWEKAYDAHTEALAALRESTEPAAARLAASTINKAIAGLAAGHLDGLDALSEAIDLLVGCKRADVQALALKYKVALAELPELNRCLLARTFSTEPIVERHPVVGGFNFIEYLPEGISSVAPTPPPLLPSRDGGTLGS